MDPGQTVDARSPQLAALGRRFDATLRPFLAECRIEIAEADPNAALLVDEIVRLVEAGGKRLRPACCFWGYRAAGGEDGEAIVRAASALELLHTMALIHDDLMDATAERRGVPASSVHLAAEAAARGFDVDPARFGVSAAILAGDLAAVLADRLLLESGFTPDALVRALDRYHRMRVEMAAGQLLDVAGLAGGDPAAARRAAALKGGSYTVEGPLLIGAALAGADPRITDVVQRFGSPLGEAFQLRDDLTDADGETAVTRTDVNDLVDRATAELESDVLPHGAADALRELAELVAVR